MRLTLLAILLAACPLGARAAEPAAARLTLAAGEWAQLDTSARAVRWASDKPALAMVTSDGWVMALASAYGGKVMITATLENADVAVTTVVVLPFEKLTRQLRAPSVESAADVEALRKRLIAAIWKRGGMSHKRRPDLVEPLGDMRLPVAGTKLMERITVKMRHGVTVKSYLFTPTSPNGKLVIYADGHSGQMELGFGAAFLETAGYFVSRGYTVLVMSMPHFGPSRTSVVRIDGRTIRLQGHEDLWLLARPDFSPLKYFFEPLLVAINFLQAERGLTPDAMIGHSGGGWMTVVYAALDRRIKRSFSVGGSYPFGLHRDSPPGDYEQFAPELFSIVDYSDLYVMGAYPRGRLQMNLYVNADPCCFEGGRQVYFEAAVKQRVAEIGGGRHDNCNDMTATAHVLSPTALAWILSEIERPQ